LSRICLFMIVSLARSAKSPPPMTPGLNAGLA